MVNLTEEERTAVEKEASKIVRNRFRPKPEYYPIPKWIRQRKELKAYYMERLQWEIDIRVDDRVRQVQENQSKNQ